MLNKILKITAALTFIVALAINIDMMINDPFAGMSTEAIATDTDSGTTGSGGTQECHLEMSCCTYLDENNQTKRCVIDCWGQNCLTGICEIWCDTNHETCQCEECQCF